MIKRNLPLMITLAVFVLGYLYCLTQFPGFASDAGDLQYPDG